MNEPYVTHYTESESGYWKEFINESNKRLVYKEDFPFKCYDQLYKIYTIKPFNNVKTIFVFAVKFSDGTIWDCKNGFRKAIEKLPSKLEKEFWGRFPELGLDDPEDEKFDELIALLRNTAIKYFNKIKDETMNNMKPIGDRILIQPITEEVSTGGIIIPETTNDVPVGKGLVVNVGTGTYSNHGIHIESEVKIGDRVLYMKFSGEDVGNGNYLVHESDVLAVIE